MITYSERARIALERLSDGARRRFDQIVSEVDQNRVARSADRKLASESDAWIAPLDDNLRLIYRTTSTGVYVDDLLDRSRYAA